MRALEKRSEQHPAGLGTTRRSSVEGDDNWPSPRSLAGRGLSAIG